MLGGPAYRIQSAVYAESVAREDHMAAAPLISMQSAVTVRVGLAGLRSCRLRCSEVIIGQHRTAVSALRGSVRRSHTALIQCSVRRSSLDEAVAL